MDIIWVILRFFVGFLLSFPKNLLNTFLLLGFGLLFTAWC